MTSRNLFFKLMREDLKRRVWAFGLAFLSFFFWMPVMSAMQISELQQRYERWIANGTTFSNGVTAEIRYNSMLADIVTETIGVLNPLNIATICVSAIVLALTGFLYLHSKKQMDFYHSIPVRRELIFAVKFVDGILIIASTYLINMLFAFGVLAVNGVGLASLLPMGFTAFAVQMGGFLINYGLMTIAVMLTGNFFVSILGGIVLFAYIPAMIGLINGLMYLFFATINTRGLDFETMMLNGSPISYYISSVTEIMSQNVALGGMDYGYAFRFTGIALAVGAVMALIALFLYTKRPSESAGKAMAFKVTKAPIKIMMVTPITIAIAILFWNIYYSVPWTVFGFVFGLVVSHCLIEIIYHFEFRKLFANLSHMGISAVLALAVIAVFRFDLVGYDSYKPEEKEFKSASMMAHNLDDWHDYGLPYKSGDNYSWNYMNGAEYAANNMEITDFAIIDKLADAGIAEAEREKEFRYANQEYLENSEGYWTSAEIIYHLNNGKSVSRNYRINVTELRETFDRLYVTSEYKEGIYPVLSYTDDNVTVICEAKRSDIQKVEADAALRSEILSTYKEEMIALTLEERAKETPVTSLRFVTKAEDEYLKFVTAGRRKNYSGEFMVEDMNLVNFFPVYPSFTKTLALLEKAGIDDFGPVQAEDVLRIEIFSDYYTDEDAYYDATETYYETRVGAVIAETAVAYPVGVSAENGLRTITLEDDGTPESVACMKMVLDAAIESDLANMNGLQSVEHGITVRVYMKETNEGRALSNQEFIQFFFTPEKIPQFVKDAFRYEDFKGKNINYGLNLNQEK